MRTRLTVVLSLFSFHIISGFGIHAQDIVDYNLIVEQFSQLDSAQYINDISENYLSTLHSDYLSYSLLSHSSEIHHNRHLAVPNKTQKDSLLFLRDINKCSVVFELKLSLSEKEGTVTIDLSDRLVPFNVLLFSRGRFRCKFITSANRTDCVRINDYKRTRLSNRYIKMYNYIYTINNSLFLSNSWPCEIMYMKDDSVYVYDNTVNRVFPLLSNEVLSIIKQRWNGK